VLAPLAPLLSPRVWCHAPGLLRGALLTPGARTVTAALRVMGLAPERHVTHDPRVLTRARWSTRHARRMLLGRLIRRLVPPGAPIVLGADDTVERRCGRQIPAQGGYREAGRATTTPVIRCVGRQWVAMRRWVPGPWRRRVWAWPLLTALCWPAQPPGQRRHKTRVDWVRQMRPPGRRWRPGRRLVWVVDGGLAAVARALAGVTHHVVRGSRRRGDAALEQPPGPQPPGTRGPQPTTGTRQRRVQAWAERSETPWDTVAVDWSGGPRTHLGVFSRTALWSTPRRPPVAIRSGLVADPEGTRRLEVFFWTALQATPVAILPWVVRRWSVEVTCAEARVPLGRETQRQWSDRASARPTPVLLGLFSRVTGLALRLSPGGQIPVPTTAWSHQAAPPLADGLALVRRHLWRARYVVNAAAEPECVPCPREAFERWLTGLPLAA